MLQDPVGAFLSDQRTHAAQPVQPVQAGHLQLGQHPPFEFPAQPDTFAAPRQAWGQADAATIMATAPLPRQQLPPMQRLTHTELPPPYHPHQPPAPAVRGGGGGAAASTTAGSDRASSASAVGASLEQVDVKVRHSFDNGSKEDVRRTAVEAGASFAAVRDLKRTDKGRWYFSGGCFS